MTKSEKIAAGKKRHGFTEVNKPRRGGSKKFEVLAVEGTSPLEIRTWKSAKITPQHESPSELGTSATPQLQN